MRRKEREQEEEEKDGKEARKDSGGVRRGGGEDRRWRRWRSRSIRGQECQCVWLWVEGVVSLLGVWSDYMESISAVNS